MKMTEETVCDGRSVGVIQSQEEREKIVSK